MVHTNQAAFAAANPGLATADFEGIAGPADFVGFPGDSRFSVAAQSPSVAGAAALGTPSAFLFEEVGSGPMRFTFTDPVNAIGFFASNGFTSGLSMRAEVFNGATLLESLILGTTDFSAFDTFFGFSGVGAITDLVVTPLSGGFVSVDDLRFGVAEVRPLPEPASMPLVVLGLLGLAAAKRKTLVGRAPSGQSCVRCPPPPPHAA